MVVADLPLWVFPFGQFGGLYGKSTHKNKWLTYCVNLKNEVDPNAYHHNLLLPCCKHFRNLSKVKTQNHVLQCDYLGNLTRNAVFTSKQKLWQKQLMKTKRVYVNSKHRHLNQTSTAWNTAVLPDVFDACIVYGDRNYCTLRFKTHVNNMILGGVPRRMQCKYRTWCSKLLYIYVLHSSGE